MRTHRITGTSLLEAMLSLALVSIILAIATPAISSWSDKQRIRSLQSSLLQMIHRARYLALSQQQRVTLCPLSPQGACQQDWSTTISTFIDNNGNRRLDLNEEVLTSLYVPDSIKLHWRGMSPNNSMHFTAQGLTSLSNGTMSLCPSNLTVDNATITINAQGRTRSNKGIANCLAK